MTSPRAYKKIGIFQVDGGYEAPVTQSDIADALGLTSAHVNHVLQSLQMRGFIDLHRGMLSIRNVPDLRDYDSSREFHLPGAIVDTPRSGPPGG